MTEFKRRKLLRKIAISVCVIAVVALVAVLIIDAIPVFADAGRFGGGKNFNRMGGGGNSRSGGGFSGGSGSGNGTSFIFGWLLGSRSGLAVFFTFIAVMMIIAFLQRKRIAEKMKSVNLNYNTPTPAPSFESLEILQERDPHFSLEAMEEKISNLYVELQDAWESQKFDPMQARLTSHLYNQLLRQMDETVKRNQVDHVDNICVLNVGFENYSCDETNDILNFIVETRITLYTTDKATGEIVRGSLDNELFMTYRWTMIRSLSVTTPAPDASGKPSASSCPHCGAPLDVNFSAKCNYCGSVISNSEYDWVLSAIEGLAQQS